MIRKLVLTFAIIPLLSGCATLSALGGASAPFDAYQIRASEDPGSARSRQNIDVIVELPSAGAAFDTESILIRPQATQVQYLPDARWIETVPEMVQTALVDGLDRTGAFRFVGRRPLGSSGDYALVTNITAFNAEVEPDGITARIDIRITARMVREADLAIVASDVFSATAVVPDTSTESLIAGFNEAGSDALDRMVGWVLSSRGVRLGT